MYDPKKTEKLKESLAKWEDGMLKASISRFPERQDRFITTSSEEIERLYTPADLD